MLRTSSFIFRNRFSDHGNFFLLVISNLYIVPMLSVLIDRSSDPVWTIQILLASPKENVETSGPQS